jgi:hypothetical protein
MGGSHIKAPSDLEGRIRTSLAAQERAQAASVPGPFHFIQTVGRRRVPPSIAAGFVLLLGAAVIATIFGLPPRGSSIGPDGGRAVASGLDFPALEHVRCSSNRTYAEQKLILHRVDEVQAYFVNELEWSIDIPDLSSTGFGFVDAGPCTLNGRSVESVHLRYQKDDVLVSVWVERAFRSDLTHLSEIVEGHAYEVIPSSARLSDGVNPTYYAWRQDDFVYRFVPASVNEARSLAILIGMPDVAIEEFR